jgi:hypothetical protein
MAYRTVVIAAIAALVVLAGCTQAAPTASPTTPVTATATAAPPGTAGTTATPLGQLPAGSTYAAALCSPGLFESVDATDPLSSLATHIRSLPAGGSDEGAEREHLADLISRAATNNDLDALREAGAIIRARCGTFQFVGGGTG